MNLQDWINRQTVDDEMLWKGAFGSQMVFIRDTLAMLVRRGLSYEQFNDVQVTVISEHRSKSIVLPVVSLERKDIGLRLILRNNFYNWKLSVISDKPIIANFDGLFHTTPPVEPDYTGNPMNPVYFEGFPKNLVFGYYEDSELRDRWSAEIHGDYAVWTTVFEIMKSLGTVKPFVWATRSTRSEP